MLAARPWRPLGAAREYGGICLSKVLGPRHTLREAKVESTSTVPKYTAISLLMTSL